MPVLGLDALSIPEDAPPPQNGELGLNRVQESLLLTLEPIAFESRSQDSVDLEIGSQQLLQPGVPGLSVTRTRVRYVDGAEIGRRAEPPATVRAAQDRLVLHGTKIVEKTAHVDGLTFTYWRSVQMYATIYSPCNSAIPGGGCSFGTASGLRAGKGVVAVDPDLFAFLNGQRLYIPGYGNAVIGDVGGGYIVEQNLGISRYKWIDLGFDDDNIQDLTGWITVYFLPPAPASIPAVLQ
jgi:3D (Asp-Asp-Asp) domain-containing protein